MRGASSSRGRTLLPTASESGSTHTKLEGQIQELLRNGRKIQAVKLVREETGVDLKEAKEAVEAVAKKHGIAAKGSGCAPVVLLGVGLSVFAAVWLVR